MAFFRKVEVDFTDSDRPVLPVRAGDSIEIRANGVVHAEGQYYRD